MSNISVIQGDIYGVRAQFDSVLVDKSINFEREAGFALQLLEVNDYALRIAMGNRQSVINAITNIAAIGISLNPAKKQAYLVPRDGKICLDISWMGLIDLAVVRASGRKPNWFTQRTHSHSIALAWLQRIATTHSQRTGAKS